MAKKTEGWFRKLDNNRLEIFLKHGDRKIRAHGPEAEMFELVEWFEGKTEVQVQGSWKRPPRRGPRQIPGQTEFTIPELELGGPPPADEPLPGGASLEPLT